MVANNVALKQYHNLGVADFVFGFKLHEDIVDLVQGGNAVSIKVAEVKHVVDLVNYAIFEQYDVQITQDVGFFILQVNVGIVVDYFCNVFE